jgi:hypothetical protein
MYQPDEKTLQEREAARAARAKLRAEKKAAKREERRREQEALKLKQEQEQEANPTMARDKSFSSFTESQVDDVQLE